MKAYEEGGLEALKEKSRRVANHKTVFVAVHRKVDRSRDKNQHLVVSIKGKKL